MTKPGQLPKKAAAKPRGGSNGMFAKVEAIVVNLMGPTQQYIQIEMTLELAKPEVAERVKLYMPVIRHKNDSFAQQQGCKPARFN